MSKSVGHRAEGDPQGSSDSSYIPGLGNYVQYDDHTASLSHDEAQDANAVPEPAAQTPRVPPTMDNTFQQPAPPARSRTVLQSITPSPYMMSIAAGVPAYPIRSQSHVSSRKSRLTGAKSARSMNRKSLDADVGKKRKRVESPSDASTEENEDSEEDAEMDSDTSCHAPVERTNAQLRRRSTRSARAEVSYVEASADEALEKILEEHENAEKTRRPRKSAATKSVANETVDIDTAAEIENDDGIRARGGNDADAPSDHGSLTNTANRTTATPSSFNAPALEQQDNKLRYEDVMHLSNVFMRPFLEQFAQAIMPLLKNDSRSEFEQVLQIAKGVVSSTHDNDNVTDAGFATTVHPAPAVNPVQVSENSLNAAVTRDLAKVKIHVTLYVNDRKIATRILSGQSVTTFADAKKTIVSLFHHDSNFNDAAIESVDVSAPERLADGSKRFLTVAHDRAYAHWAHQFLRNPAGPRELDMCVYIDEVEETEKDAAGGCRNEGAGQEHQAKADDGYRADDDDSSSESVVSRTA